MQQWNVELKPIEDSEDVILEFPDEVVKIMHLHENDILDFTLKSDGCVVITKAKKYRHLWKPVTY